MGEDSDVSEASEASEASASPPEEGGTKIVKNVSYDFFDLANAAGKFSRNPQSKLALDNFFNKLKYLEQEWYEFGDKYEQISRRNESLEVEYERERHKAKVYQKRLKFVKENQGNVERLRELYDSIKTLEDKSLLEKEVQTEDQNVISVDKDTFISAKETLNAIKEMVGKRESKYDENNKKLEIFKARVDILESQNTQLTQLLKETVNQENKSSTVEGEDGEGKKNCEENKLPSPTTEQQMTGFTSILKVIEIPVDDSYDRDTGYSDVEIPLNTIRSMKSSVTSTLSKVRSSLFGLPVLSNESVPPKSKGFGRGDCREVEVLKKIRTEIEKKQQSIKRKIDMFNNLMQE